MYVDKETGRMMNAENDKKEANIEKLRKSFEAIQSDTLLKQDQYLALLTAAFAKFIDSNEPIQQQGRGTKGTGNPYEKE